jgi:hypothetical protein
MATRQRECIQIAAPVAPPGAKNRPRALRRSVGQVAMAYAMLM